MLRIVEILIIPYKMFESGFPKFLLTFRSVSLEGKFYLFRILASANQVESYTGTTNKEFLFEKSATSLVKGDPTWINHVITLGPSLELTLWLPFIMLKSWLYYPLHQRNDRREAFFLKEKITEFFPVSIFQFKLNQERFISYENYGKVSKSVRIITPTIPFCFAYKEREFCFCFTVVNVCKYVQTARSAYAAERNWCKVYGTILKANILGVHSLQAVAKRDHSKKWRMRKFYKLKISIPFKVLM